MSPHTHEDSATERPLSDHVQAYLDRTGLSRRTLAEQCRDPETGQTLNHTYIGDLVSNRVPRAPEMWRLRALAAGTPSGSIAEGPEDYRRRLDELKRMAAIQWLELGDVLRVETGGGAWITVHVPESLSDRRRQTIVKLAEDMARSLDEEERQSGS